jgi:hypothetical protein
MMSPISVKSEKNMYKLMAEFIKGQNPIKLSEGALIRSMLFFDNDNNGWMTMKQILKYEKPKTWDIVENGYIKRNYKNMPSIANFTHYIKELVNYGLVEERWVHYVDSKKRKCKRREYRLIQSKEVVYLLGHYFIKTKETFDHSIPYIQEINKTKEGQRSLQTLTVSEQDNQLMLLKFKKELLNKELKEIENQIKLEEVKSKK